MIDEIRGLYEYHRWANHRLLDAVSKLTPEQFNQNLQSSFPSVRDTLVHMMGADWIWLARWKGVSPASQPDTWDLSSFESIRAQWLLLEAQQTAYISALSDAALRSWIDYRTLKGEPFSNPLWQLLRHVVNHASYHRGQITTMLRQLGAAAVSTDLIVFYREKAPAQPQPIAPTPS